MDVEYKEPCIGNPGAKVEWHWVEWGCYIIVVGEIWVIFPSGVVSVWVGVVLWVWVEVLHSIDMLNSLKSGLTLNNNVALNATDLI